MIVVMDTAEKPGGGVISLLLVMPEKKFRRRPTAKGVGLRKADSYTGNHPEDGFTPLETIRSFFHFHSKSASGCDASADSTAKADPLKSAPNDSILHQQGMDEGTKNYAPGHIFAGTNLSILVDQTKSTGDGLKTVHTNLAINEESRSDEISKKIKLEDLSDLRKDIISAFFTLESLQYEHIIVSDESEEVDTKKDKDTHATSHDDKLEQQKAKAKAEVASLKARPSYPDINQLIELLEKLKTLDSLPSLSNKVTDTLNRFSTVVENASRATGKSVPSAGLATASPAEGEKNTIPATKDAETTNLHNELVDLLGIDVVTQYYNKKLLYDKYYDKMLKIRKSSKIINSHVLT
ncbi:hypothetical protein Tco_0778156 [Tanacetum coccineum]